MLGTLENPTIFTRNPCADSELCARIAGAVDPLTRGALRERMQLVGSAVHLRSFLDPPTPPGHTIKGSGLVSFSDNRWNTTNVPMDYALQRACESHMQSLGVSGSNYNYLVSVLAASAKVSINGRR